MADDQDVDLVERLAAVRAALEPFLHRLGLGQLPGVPMRPLNRPRDDVLEAAEGGAPLTGRLVGAKAGIGLDVFPAPGTRLCRLDHNT